MRCASGEPTFATLSGACGSVFLSGKKRIVISGEDTSAAAQAASSEMTRYCTDHPRSPSAVRKPKLILRGRSVVALLGYTIQDGVAGIGSDVAAALRDFDRQYLRAREPQNAPRAKTPRDGGIPPRKRRARHA